MVIFDIVAWIHIENRKLLQSKNKNQEGYYMPGGKVEEGEDFSTALIREMKEELMIDLLPETIKLYGIVTAQAYLKPLVTLVRAHCYTASFTGVITPSTEIETIGYFSQEEYFALSDKAPGCIKIFTDLRKKGLID